jgi:hypothetical protein
MDWQRYLVPLAFEILVSQICQSTVVSLEKLKDGRIAQYQKTLVMQLVEYGAQTVATFGLSSSVPSLQRLWKWVSKNERNRSSRSEDTGHGTSRSRDHVPGIICTYEVRIKVGTLPTQITNSDLLSRAGPLEPY